MKLRSYTPKLKALGAIIQKQDIFFVCFDALRPGQTFSVM